MIFETLISRGRRAEVLKRKLKFMFDAMMAGKYEAAIDQYRVAGICICGGLKVEL